METVRKIKRGIRMEECMEIERRRREKRCRKVELWGSGERWEGKER